MRQGAEHAESRAEAAGAFEKQEGRFCEGFGKMIDVHGRGHEKQHEYGLDLHMQEGYENST